MKNWAIIVAIGENNEIGKDNDLLWRISADMKRFKSITTGHTLVMGRKTFDSLPKGALPNRRNVVLSHQNKELENVEFYPSVPSLIENIDQKEQVFVIGGASLYQAFIDKVDVMYITKVHASFSADVFFPDFDWEDWEVFYEEFLPKGDRDEFPHTFYQLKRKKN